jgi:hypothetical protein
MAYMNWKKQSLTVECDSAMHQKRGAYGQELWTARLLVPKGFRAELGEGLQGAFAPHADEHRFDINSQWTLYAKPSAGDARFLVARPEPEIWVASFLMDPFLAPQILAEVMGPSQRSFFQALRALGISIHPSSNLDLRFDFGE